MSRSLLQGIDLKKLPVLSEAVGVPIKEWTSREREVLVLADPASEGVYMWYRLGSAIRIVEVADCLGQKITLMGDEAQIY